MTHLTIDQLIYFSEVYQQRSINAASLNLHISQQSLSTSIRQLEKEFSTTFFIRSRKGVTPTAAGERFYRSAQIIINELLAFEHSLETEKDMKYCKIALLSWLSPALSSQLFKKLSKAFPDVFFDLIPFSYNDLLSTPTDQYPDIIFNFLIKDQVLSYPEQYVLKHISKTPKTIRIWLSSSSPLAQYNVLTPKHILDASFCFSHSQGDSASVLNYFSKSNVVPKKTYFAATEEIFIDLLKSGAYCSTEICINDRPLFHHYLLSDKDLILKPLSDDFEKIYFFLLYKKSCEKFYPLIADYLNQHYNV